MLKTHILALASLAPSRLQVVVMLGPGVTQCPLCLVQPHLCDCYAEARVPASNRGRTARQHYERVLPTNSPCQHYIPSDDDSVPPTVPPGVWYGKSDHSHIWLGSLLALSPGICLKSVKKLFNEWNPAVDRIEASTALKLDAQKPDNVFHAISGRAYINVMEHGIKAAEWCQSREGSKRRKRIKGPIVYCTPRFETARVSYSLERDPVCIHLEKDIGDKCLSCRIVMEYRCNVAERQCRWFENPSETNQQLGFLPEELELRKVHFFTTLVRNCPHCV